MQVKQLKEEKSKMTTLNVKIVGVEGEAVMVKFASENSAKNIDEYESVVYYPKAMGYQSVEEFIEGVKPSLLGQVALRDKQESAPAELDLSAWHGHESAHEISTNDTEQTGKEVVL